MDLFQSTLNRPPSGTEIWRRETLDLGTLPPLGARIYGKRVSGENRPLALHFHGGAFVGGSLEQDYLVARLLAEAGAVVISLDYPLAPEHPFPIAVEAGLEALAWIHADENRSGLGGRASKVYVAGEEAGGNLAAAVAMAARDRQGPKLSGQILISPMLNPALATASMREANAGASGCRFAAGWCQYLSKLSDADHPYAVPGTAARLSGLPMTLLLTASDDPMRDDTIAYALRLREAGVEVDEALLPGPTGWPCSLMNQDECLPAWAADIRRRLENYFESIKAAQANTPASASLSI